MAARTVVQHAYLRGIFIVSTRLWTGVVGWLFRQGFVFVLIVAALAFHQLVWPMIAGGGAQSAITNEWKSPADIRAELNALKQQMTEDLEVLQSELLAKTGSALTAALQEKREELAAVEEQLDQRQGVFASVRLTAIIAREKLKLRRARLSAEIDLLNSLKNREAARMAAANHHFRKKPAVPDLTTKQTFATISPFPETCQSI